MRVLVVKTSSMGDVLHTLPALSDAARHHPEIRFDWVVEEGFAEIPAWHPAVEEVIPVAWRRWRRNPVSAFTGGEWSEFRKHLRVSRYDCVIDAQGLMKSAVIACMARGERHGPDRGSAREPVASAAYHRRYNIAWGQHAIERVRKLFAEALGYAYHDDAPQYGIRGRRFNESVQNDTVLFLHGTTWPTKQWPEAFWIELAERVGRHGLDAALAWGTSEERARAERIAAACPTVEVLPQMSLTRFAETLVGARGAVAVDSGLGHLAAALEVPTVSVYGATDPARTGTRGVAQHHVQAQFECAPCLSRSCHYTGSSDVYPACYATTLPGRVWEMLHGILGVPA